MSIALACDIRIAAASASMVTGYARIGLTGDYGISWLLTRLVGTSRARELMFLSERIDARRCEALGLINRVVEDGELQGVAFALARQLASGPAFALARIKDNLDHAMMATLLDSLDHEAANLVSASQRADHKEAVRAFKAAPDLFWTLIEAPSGPTALHRLDDILGDLLGVAEQHHGVVAIEQRIVDAGITRGQ
ncbi:putative Enoyl-CoA hydratase [Bradyrhizobium vignae]|uniref:Putative Enoyl-CoA hydratase n=1 Tax=Bradyrhizobium vignae TaxID=1549949 RepID=A0A2U3PUP3_9BRAD|nr:putative Enoyl-CoA hydratase [Bradyrhizobium vignae]